MCFIEFKFCTDVTASELTSFLHYYKYYFTCSSTAQRLEIFFPPYLKSALLETELIYLSVPRSSQNLLPLMHLCSKPVFGENAETPWLFLKVAL